MTEQAKCLPGCRPVLGPIPQEWDGVAEMQISHATGCPRDSEPKPPLHAHPNAPKPAQNGPCWCSENRRGLPCEHPRGATEPSAEPGECECCGVTHTEASSDEEIESHFDRIFAFLASKRRSDPIQMVLKSKYDELRAELAAIKAQAEDATEYVLAVENRELRAKLAEREAQVKRCHGIMQSMVSNMEVDESADCEKELSGEFCPGACTTSCDKERAELETERAAALKRVEELEEREDNLRMAVSDDDGSMVEMWERTNAAVTAICDAANKRLSEWIAARAQEKKA